MKQIGLLGGTSWPSTIEYYRLLNQYAQDRYGEGHSARLLLWNIDYYNIKRHYPDGWPAINAVLKEELEAFAKTKPACILICNNTLHEGYDQIKQDLVCDIPVLHMPELTAQALHKAGHKKVLLLGTQYTMEAGYYAQKIEHYGIEVVVPNLQERQAIGSMQRMLATGEVNEKFNVHMQEMLTLYTHCDAIVTACTELPLVITPEITALPIIDPLTVQCQAAFEFATTP